MSQEFVTTALRENVELWQRVRRFNCQPALFAHPGHISEQIDQSLFQRLSESRRGERALSKWLTQVYQLDQTHWDFHDLPSRLALLSRDELEKLILLAGTAALHGAIVRVVDRKSVLRIKSDLGDDVYLFAVKRAPFLMASVKDTLSPPQLESDVASQARRVGLDMLSTCLSKQLSELRPRLQLKLPPHLRIDSEGANNESVNGLGREPSWALLKKIALSEINPDLSSCLN